MDPAVQQAVVQVVQKRRAAASSSKMWKWVLLGLFVMVVIVIVVLRVTGRRKKAEAEERLISVVGLKETKEKVAAAAEEIGIPAEEMEKALEAELKEDKEKRCNVSPLPNGLCGQRFHLENGCCYANETKFSQRNQDLQMARDIITEVSVGLFAGFVLETMLAMGIQAGLTKTAGGAAVRGATTAGARAATTGAKAGKAVRAAAAAARAARAAMAAARTAATAGTKYATAASAGPPGWIAAAVMLVFDAVMLTMDLLDVDGYESYTAQGVLAKMKNVIDYSMASEFEKMDMDYPLIFPLTTMYPGEMQTAQEHMNGQLVEKYMQSEMQLPKNKKTKDAFEAYVQKIVDDPSADPPVPPEFTSFIIQLIEDKHVERDQLIYDKLKELLGDKAYTIAYYKEISAPGRMGVSLSEKGAKEWNSEQEAKWLKENDLYKPPDPLTLTEPAPAACYTDTYYVYESGPADNPTMVAKKLPVKTVLGNYYGSLVAFCEKSRQIKSTSTSVNPKALGTRFNFNSGVCEFSRDYCKRYGLVYKDNDCEPRPGQTVAEMIFGKTVTRGMMRLWDERKDDITSGDPGRVATGLLRASPMVMLAEMAVTEGMKSYAKKSTPATKGPCPPGMRDDGMNCYLDPYKIPTGTFPNVCRESEPTQIGRRCYEDCPGGYEPNEVVRTLCEPKCGGDYPLKRGLICYEDCRNRGGGWFNGSLLECAACNNGWRSDGFLGCTKRGGWKPAWPYRSRRKQRGIGTPKERKHHSVKCKEGKVERGGLCYEPCKNKGDQGQYKYKGVLDWCQPEGGAGIKKGIDDRWTCPAGMERKGPVCYEPCKEGERDDGLFCKKAG